MSIAVLHFSNGFSGIILILIDNAKLGFQLAQSRKFWKWIAVNHQVKSKPNCKPKMDTQKTLIMITSFLLTLWIISKINCIKRWFIFFIFKENSVACRFTRFIYFSSTSFQIVNVRWRLGRLRNGPGEKIYGRWPQTESWIKVLKYHFPRS